MKWKTYGTEAETYIYINLNITLKYQRRLKGSPYLQPRNYLAFSNFNKMLCSDQKKAQTNVNQDVQMLNFIKLTTKTKMSSILFMLILLMFFTQIAKEIPQKN